MDESDNNFRIQIKENSTWRIYSLCLCAFVFLIVVLTWPYVLPQWLFSLLFIPFVFLLFSVLKAFIKNTSHVQNEPQIMYLSLEGDIQFLKSLPSHQESKRQKETKSPERNNGNGKLQGSSFYLFGVYHLIVCDLFTAKKTRLLIYGDQLSSLDNRRLRRVINRLKRQ